MSKPLSKEQAEAAAKGALLLAAAKHETGRDYRGTTVEIERIRSTRFMEDRWRWQVKIPAWMIDGGLKASGANPSGEALTRRGALKAARQAVKRQMAIDAREVAVRRWDAIGEDWV